MSKHRDPSLPPSPAHQDAKTATGPVGDLAGRAMSAWKQQLGLDERAWRSMILSVREPTWDPPGDPRR